MTDPITPPPELVQQWLDTLFDEGGLGIDPHKLSMGLAARAAQWGADQELEACCEWFVRDWTDIETADKLRAARRPKSPSLKEQALELVDRLEKAESPWVVMSELATIRRALEQLND